MCLQLGSVAAGSPWHCHAVLKAAAIHFGQPTISEPDASAHVPLPLPHCTCRLPSHRLPRRPVSAASPCPADCCSAARLLPPAAPLRLLLRASSSLMSAVSPCCVFCHHRRCMFHRACRCARYCPTACITRIAIQLHPCIPSCSAAPAQAYPLTLPLPCPAAHPCLPPLQVTQHAQCRVRVTVRKEPGAVPQQGHKVRGGVAGQVQLTPSAGHRCAGPLGTACVHAFLPMTMAPQCPHPRTGHTDGAHGFALPAAHGPKHAAGNRGGAPGGGCLARQMHVLEPGR